MNKSDCAPDAEIIHRVKEMRKIVDRVFSDCEIKKPVDGREKGEPAEECPPAKTQ
jgi:hypothetical protein